MSRPIFVSTTSFESRELGRVLELCERGHIDALELSSLDAWDVTLLQDRRYPRRFLVHNYFPRADPPFVLNLASQDAGVLERSRAHCRAAIDLSWRLEAEVYAAHAGYTADLEPALLGDPVRQAALPAERLSPRGGAYATLVESARELSEYGSRCGVRFLIENHVLPAAAGERGAELLLMVAPDELERLVDDVHHPGFGLLVDVGHLKVSAATLGLDPAACLDRLGPAIVGLHLSDNDGSFDTHSSFGADAWFIPKLAAFPTASVTLELAHLGLEEITDVRDTVAAWL